MSAAGANDPKFDTSEMLAATIPASDVDEWDVFEAGEALIVASRYALGEVTAVREFRRGSRRAPKLLIKCDKGLVLLKRLAPGRDDPSAVESHHQVQKLLADAGFPLPRLAHVRHGTSTMVLHAGRTYELFEAVRGEAYDLSAAQTQDAGRVLAHFHAVLGRHRLDVEDGAATYHRNPAVEAALRGLAGRGIDAAVLAATAELYARAGHHAENAGFGGWHRQIVHGDWHPGNMSFRGGEVVAVFDYDTLRTAPRALDLAMGALQFSLRRSESSDPLAWPPEADQPRLRRFIQGYDSFPASMVSRSELEALPWLMVEALIAEPVLQVWARGKFGRLEGAPALSMVLGKARWLAEHHERVRLVAS